MKLKISISPKRTAQLLVIVVLLLVLASVIAAGSVFVAGAIRMDLIGGRYLEQQDGADMIYAMMTANEEFLEMLGVIVFIYALLSYLRSHMEVIQLWIDDRETVGVAIEPLAHQITQGDLQ